MESAFEYEIRIGAAHPGPTSTLRFCSSCQWKEGPTVLGKRREPMPLDNGGSRYVEAKLFFFLPVTAAVILTTDTDVVLQTERGIDGDAEDRNNVEVTMPSETRYIIVRYRHDTWGIHSIRFITATTVKSP